MFPINIFDHKLDFCMYVRIMKNGFSTHGQGTNVAIGTLRKCPGVQANKLNSKKHTFSKIKRLKYSIWQTDNCARESNCTIRKIQLSHDGKQWTVNASYLT